MKQIRILQEMQLLIYQLIVQKEMFEDYNPSSILDENGNFRQDYKNSEPDYTITPTLKDSMDQKIIEIRDILNNYHYKKMNNKDTSINKKAMYLMDRAITELGLTPEQAAGLAGNIMQESRFDPKAVGDNGKAHGIAQWHPNRRKNINMLNTSFEDQVTYMIEELKGPEKSALRRLRLTGDSTQAATVVDHYYERSSKQHTKSRIKYAEDFLKLFGM